jgi:FkbM family methyltransferase
MTLNMAQNLSCLSAVVKTIRRNLLGKKLESELEALPQLLVPGAVCMDIGAAYGRYAYVLSRLSGANGKVYCFEPGEYSRRVLVSAVKFHGLKNVEIMAEALSDKPGSAKLVVPMKKDSKMAPSLAHLADVSPEGAAIVDSVTVDTLDGFVARKGISRVDFIKCDVEGGEPAVFAGARETLQRFKPVVLCEIYRGHLSKLGSTPEALKRMFDDLGYETFVYENGALARAESIFKDHNYFFIHPNRQSQG